MKNPLNNLMTRDEQKILGFLSIILSAGMIFHYAGLTPAFAEKNQTEQIALEQATERDSVILIDIRIAGPEELVLLSGVGEKRAQDIINYRQNKQFYSTEELLNIKGIGAKTYLSMKPMLLSFGTFGKGVTDIAKLNSLKELNASPESASDASGKQELDGTDPPLNKEQSKSKSVSVDKTSIINLNTASKQDLISLDGIGEVRAEAILSYRSQIGKFTSIEQLLEVKGIGTKTLEKNRHRLSL